MISSAEWTKSWSVRARKTLDRKGVELRTGAMVEDVDADGVRAGGECIAAGTVIWTAGVRGSRPCRMALRRERRQGAHQRSVRI